MNADHELKRIHVILSEDMNGNEYIYEVLDDSFMEIRDVDDMQELIRGYIDSDLRHGITSRYEYATYIRETG